MTDRKPLKTDEELLTALTHLFNELDVESDNEVDNILREAGYIPDVVGKRARKLVDTALAKSPLNWRNQQPAIARIKERAKSIGTHLLSRTEMEAQVKQLIASAAGSQSISTHFRNFVEMTDDDLASWLEELQMLVSSADTDDDKQ